MVPTQSLHLEGPIVIDVIDAQHQRAHISKLAVPGQPRHVEL
jgi:hypothetical protein